MACAPVPINEMLINETDGEEGAEEGFESASEGELDEGDWEESTAVVTPIASILMLPTGSLGIITPTEASVMLIEDSATPGESPGDNGTCPDDEAVRSGSGEGKADELRVEALRWCVVSPRALGILSEDLRHPSTLHHMALQHHDHRR